MSAIFWFMTLQMLTCLIGGLAWGFIEGGFKGFWTGWIWVSYAQANIGFMMLATR